MEEKDGSLTVTASEAKQMWLEREVRSLKVALDRVAVPQVLQQSGYWNTGFDYGDLFKPSGPGVPGHRHANPRDNRALCMVDVAQLTFMIGLCVVDVAQPTFKIGHCLVEVTFKIGPQRFRMNFEAVPGLRSCMENTKRKIGLVLSMGFIVTMVGLSLSMGFIVITVGLSLSMDFLVDKLGLHLSTENILDKLGLCLSRSGLCRMAVRLPGRLQSSHSQLTPLRRASFWLLRLSESRKIRRGHAGYMMGVPSGSSAIERVLYGDNVAAIVLAHGTSSSSWRTRHLKIWAAYLREALEGRAPGGLYMAPSTSSRCWIGGRWAHQTTFWPGRRDFIGGPWNAAWQKGSWAPWWWTSECCHCSDDDWELVAFRYGCETGDDAESMAIWACGAVLMVFGAVYVGQLPMKSMMCCLKRLRGPPRSFEEDNRQRLGGGRRSSVRIKRGKGSSSSNPSSTSLSIKIRPGTGIQHRDENLPEASSRGSSERVPFAAEGDAFAAVLPRTSSTASGSAGAAVLPRTSSTTSGSASAAVLFCCTSMPTWQR